MSGYLLDTNVVSEVVKSDPEPRVVSFLLDESDLRLSTIVLHELTFGLGLLPDGRRRDLLGHALASFIAGYADMVLPVDRSAADHAANLRVQAHRAGRVLTLTDALIAGTALANNLAIATRNVEDFRGLDAPIFNPWDTSDHQTP